MGARGWFRIHSFTGVITGLMLFVVCWSGTFAVLSQELDWLVTPEVRVGPGDRPPAWDAWAAAVKHAFPGAELQWLSIPRGRRFASEAVVNLPQQDLVRVYIDPATLDVTGHYSYVNLQRFFRNFHMNLFGLGGAGIYVVTTLGLTLLVSLAAALVFYRRWWRRFFCFRRGGGRALWSEFHKVLGLWSLWFVVLMGATGGWYLFEMARVHVGDGKFSYAGTGPAAVHRVPEPASVPTTAPLAWDALMRRVNEARPDLQARAAGPGRSHPGAFYVEGQAGHLLVRDRANQVHLDQASGEILHHQDAAGLPLYWRWSHTADPLHFGNFAGLTSKIVWFTWGLMLCGIILSGTYLHARRLDAGAGGYGRHRWPGTGGALVVSLGVLIAAVVSGFQQARDVYGPVVDGVRQLPTLAPGVKAVIIGWSGLTLAIILGWVFVLWCRTSPSRRGGPAAASRGRCAPGDDGI